MNAGRKPMKEELREEVLRLGADVCGFAGIERFSDAPAGFHPSDIFQNCKSIITFGIALPKGIYAADSRLIYSYYNSFACPQADRIAYQTAVFLENVYHGTGVPLPSDGPYDYWNEEKLEGRGLLSMKHAAYLSGIGTFGKSTLLLNKTYGNRLVIGCVLTDLETGSDEFAANICPAHCNLCIQSCPVGAISANGVEQKLCRANSYSQTERGFDTVECTRCRTICPMRFGLAETDT